MTKVWPSWTSPRRATNTLPGVACRGTINPFALVCADDSEPWPIGLDNSGIKAFRGIPYGADTGGKNRFMPPKKPKPWTANRCSPETAGVSVAAIRGTSRCSATRTGGAGGGAGSSIRRTVGRRSVTQESSR